MAAYSQIFSQELEQLAVYGTIREDPALTAMRELFANNGEGSESEKAAARQAYYRLLPLLVEEAEEQGFSGNLFVKHMVRLVLENENPYSLALEGSRLDAGSTLSLLGKRDLISLYSLIEADWEALCETLGRGENIYAYVPCHIGYGGIVDEIVTDAGGEAFAESVKASYMQYGCGKAMRRPMLKFDGKKLTGVENPDLCSFDSIIGYGEQKRLLLENAEAFVNGAPAHNALLIGARGTGKSTCVKAIAQRFYHKGLRIVEITRDQVEQIPALLTIIKKRGFKFIIFLDDLSFDEFEVGYKYLKSLLEGSVEKRPENALFFATSNKRHIVQEKWGDKEGSLVENGEIHVSDALNEKLSLSDRFGLTITFSKPGPGQYWDIVRGLAAKEGLDVSEDTLKRKAMEWELNQNGLSGRSARQFVNSIICEIRK